jgi:hypothetical protein
MDEETLEGAIIGCLNVIGEEKVYELVSKCTFTDLEDTESVSEGREEEANE